MDLALLIFLPFGVAMLLAIPALKPFFSRFVRASLTVGTMSVLFVALVGYFPHIQAVGASMGAVTRAIEWVPELGLSLSFYLDGLSLLFALIITGVGTGIFLYTAFYFDNEDDSLRFTTSLMAFAGAMLGVVLAGNLLLLFILWELTSITSFLLIGFYGSTDEKARFGALQALIITSGGALALLLGFVLLGAVGGQSLGGGFTFDLERLLQLDPITAHPYYSVMALLVMLGAFTKSAQFPFHFWLPNAMSAPTPASAYLHSATMVKAGIYLLLRLYPLMQGGNIWTIGLITIGTVTLFIGAYFALGKRDLKGVLAYLTVSTLGAIVALIGLPEYEGIKAAILMIVAHALYKAALFLSVGTIEHNTGTRNLDHLGGLVRYMPGFAVVVLVSVLSMAGIFPLFGFIAKETFLDAFLHWEVGITPAIVGVVFLATTLSIVAGFIIFWDVFFKAPTHEIHFHPASWVLSLTPIALAIGSVLLTVFVVGEILLEPLVQQITPKIIHLHLFPEGGFGNSAFQLSTLAIGLGLILFRFRKRWLWLTNPPLWQGTSVFKGIIQSVDWLGNQALKTQNGQIRYYLVVIFSALAFLLIASGQLTDLITSINVNTIEVTTNSIYILKAILLILCCASAVYVTIVKNHLIAALALGLVGYTIGGLFLLEPAPDVALVQFLVETLGTILIIVMLARISPRQRQAVMAKLWKGRSKLDDMNLGIYRDMLVAGAVGVAVFLFTLTALISRPTPNLNDDLCAHPLAQGQNLDREGRTSITVYHICNNYADFHITDIVGGIVTDYRGMDTIIEISVFTVAALGVLTLLSRGLNMQNPLSAKRSKAYSELDREALSEIQDATSLSTPFTRYVSRLVLLLGFVVALAQINYGGVGPGDGFTAGSFLGLAVALWYVVFGYAEAKDRLKIFAPSRLIRAGLVLVICNALLPILLGRDFMSFVEYDRLLGLYDVFEFFGLHLTSTLVYETSIFLTVFGSFSAIVEAIAHPQESAELDPYTLEEAH